MNDYYVKPHSNIEGSFAVMSHKADAHCKKLGMCVRPCFGVYKREANAIRKRDKLNEENRLESIDK